MVPVPWVLFGIGAASVLVSIPLVLRKVPRNHWYGIRVRKAFVSDDNWYAINAVGGWLFILFGTFLMAVGWFSRGIAPAPDSVWAPVFMVIPLLALIPVILMINLLARRLPDK